jgi:hypothetical protein
MNCDNVKKYIDDYFDRSLSANDEKNVMDHLVECSHCQDLYQQEKEFRLALEGLSVPPPSQGFSERVFRNTVETSRRQLRRRSWLSTGGAVAAGLAIWFMVGMPGESPQLQQQNVPMTTMNLHASKTIKMILHASQNLKSATVTVELPEHIEIEGFPGKRSISWDTDLYKGKNLLALPVVAKTTGKDQMITRIEHESKSKLLKMEMLVNGSPMKSHAGDKQFG